MDLEVVNMNDESIEYYQTITSTSASFSYIPSQPIVLPFSDPYGRQVNYMIRISGLTPRNNEIHCNCPNRNTWKKYILAYGVSDDTIQDLYDGTTQIYAQGISLQFNYSCNYDWMCAEYDWRTGFGKTHAETTFLCCVVELLTVLLNRATPFTPAPPEYFAEKKNEAMAMIEDNIDWLAENLPRVLNHCTNCKKSRIGVGEIVV